MIRRKEKTIKVDTGEPSEIVVLIPENDEDLRELKRLKAAGLLDDRESFADDPEAWEE